MTRREKRPIWRGYNNEGSTQYLKPYLGKGKCSIRGEKCRNATKKVKG
jgi:hypothetical protein